MADPPGKRILADRQFAAVANLDHPLNIRRQKVIEFHFQHCLGHWKYRHQTQLRIKQMKTAFGCPDLMIKRDPNTVLRADQREPLIFDDRLGLV